MLSENRGSGWRRITGSITIFCVFSVGLLGEEMRKFMARGKRKQFEKIAGQELAEGSSCFFFVVVENIQTDCQSLSVLGSTRKPPPWVALKMAKEQQNYDRNLVL